MKKLFLTLLLLFSFSFCFAEDGVGATVDSISIEMNIGSDLSVTQTLRVSAHNSHTVDSSFLYLFLDDIPNDVKIMDENGTIINYSSFIANNIFTIRILDKLETNASKEYTIIYNNDNTVQSFDKNFVFSYIFSSYYELDSFTLALILPRGFGITMQEGNTVSPPTSRLFSDGQQIIIEWTDDLEYLDTITYLVFFERIFSSYSIVWIFVAGILGFVFGSVSFYIYYKKKSKKIVTMALSSDEKKLVDYVLKKGNNVFQNSIGKDLDFSKPKLSKMVHGLEEKNILKVTPSGRKNKIEINKKII